ncbi:Fur family transcriptional regulator [Leucobacter denitrificans]|uniref:Transcriptional repressor n=1 Tax=Leucobacter denitrificans TaxID=683042 RepID=A0A7G9S3D8_9MICO|nr:Fur family transcriptional regulator [Leucobacter denitrificans]QNN62363.1 transcriptional repressor [Leucobacter denitrificans]
MTEAQTVDPTQLSEQLNAVGLRSTAQRRAVMEVLARGGHWTAADVFDAVAKDLDGTSLQAVYGVLSALTEVGLARKIEPPNSPALYERRVGDNHHHLVCTECGEIKDVPCAVGEAPCLTASEQYGYAIHTAEVTYHGVCPTCRAA